jgi:ABC-type multidrug transport system ATPase subunit
VILSSHLLELIEALATRILILDHGRRVFVGTMAEARATLAPAQGSSLEEIFSPPPAARRRVSASAGRPWRLLLRLKLRGALRKHARRMKTASGLLADAGRSRRLFSSGSRA